MTQSPPEAKRRFHRDDPTAVPVVLLAPYMAEGTVVFHQDRAHPGNSGDFFPSRTHVSISEKTRCQLLLAKSRVVLNVTLHPPATEGSPETFPFEIAAWEPMELPAKKAVAQAL
ncbi:hypothetical protein [Prosthecobacter sp.]|uniref:hypothetical protein n=1 Tax=Prosthecobacter sp. TaxID=1965333 RepID=UPI0037846163